MLKLDFLYRVFSEEGKGNFTVRQNILGNTCIKIL